MNARACIVTLAHWLGGLPEFHAGPQRPCRTLSPETSAKCLSAPVGCLAYHAEPQTVDVLSVDAWADGLGGWTWNAWHRVGEVPRAWLSLSKRRLLRLLRSEGYLSAYSAGRVMVDDDGFNFCIQERNGRTVFALAYGERQ